MTEKLCFFGSSYTGQQCRCGWRKEMKKDVPTGYLQEDGKVKFYMLNRWTADGYIWYSYGARRNKEYKSDKRSPGQKLGTFWVNHDTYEVKSRGDWPQSIERYLNHAKVEKGDRGVFTCIGVADDDDDEEEQEKELQKTCMSTRVHGS